MHLDLLCFLQYFIFLSLYSQHPLLLFSFYCTKSTQARPNHLADAFHERKTKSEDTDISPNNVESDVVGSAPDPDHKSKPEPKAETDVGVLPEMRATHVKGFLSRGLQEAMCPGESVVCDDGMAGNVTCQVACAEECCVGGYFDFDGTLIGPCTRFNGTLCKDVDTPPCSGFLPCTYANIGTVVQGCNANGACRRANIGSVSYGCNANDACPDANIGSVDQGCNAFFACALANIGSVSYACCNASYAC